MDDAQHARGGRLLFETERLLVRELCGADVAALHAVYGDAAAMRWVGDGRPLSLAGCREWVGVTERNYRDRGYGMAAIVSKRTGNVIGFCGIVHPRGQAAAEVKYALGRAHWRQGLATEAVRALLDWSAARHGLDRIIATVAPANAASQRVLAKVGMTPGWSRRDDDGSWTTCFVWRAGDGRERAPVC